MKNNLKVFWVLLSCCAISQFAKADLLGVNPSYPQINFVNTDASALSYDPISGTLVVNANPYNIFLSETESVGLVASNSTMQIQFATDGTNVSGTNGFTITGQVTIVQGSVSNTYSGTLLQGNVVAFGSQYSGTVNQFDFRIQLTGGQIQSLFDCSDTFAVTLNSEDSTFTGSFATNFNGGAKGYCGPEDTIPPSITCPPLSQVVTTPATDPNNPANQGFIVTYPNPIVTDNCDPDPQIFCDTPSGSFVALNPGDQLTINCYGLDVSGNYSVCSFTVTMGQPATCSLGFTNGGVHPPVTLPCDIGSCSATYVFPLPVATNCSGQAFVATATALSENGTVIPLTATTNGMVLGVFPKTLTTNGDIITFTASDGQGDTAVEQLQVFVKDTQAPEIFCMNQTATFKPILTNALSCISATFNNLCIASNNYLWFSSVIQPVSYRYNNGNFTVHVFNQTIQLSVDNTNITLSVPDAYVYFSNGVASATSIFTNGQWVTYSSLGCSGNTFVSGLAWQLPFNLNNTVGGCWGRDFDNGFMRRHVNSATWCARFAIDTPGIALQWQWGAVVEKTLSTNYNALSVKPVDCNYGSWCRNNDPAGSCETYRNSLVTGACGRGYTPYGQPDCTGILSQPAPCNLGKGIVCEGPVYFKTPMAADNCDDSVQVTCNPPSGTVFGPGNQTITATAVDSSGNSNQCTFTLTVLAPLQVVFDSPACDNVADNTAAPDAGYNDMNCPDDPSTPESITCFHVGDRISHVCRLLDCTGNDVTSSMMGCVTMHIDVTERRGAYSNSVLVNDLTQGQAGTPGCIMVPGNGNFQYTLNTAGCQSGTVNTSTFFRSCVWVDYNSSPGVPVGMEDVLLQSR